MKHTPGNFKVEKKENGELVVVTRAKDFGLQVIATIHSLPRFKAADAQLFAAAPELLEALEQARNAISYFQGDEMQVLEIIDSAIAKAKGKNDE